VVVKVASLDDYPGVTATLWPWEDLGDRVEVTEFRERVDDVDRLVEMLEPFEIVIAMRDRTEFSRELIERLPNLRLLCTTGPGNASFDMQALADRGILVTGSSVNLDTTVELAWGLMLAVARNIVAEDQSIRNGGWSHTVGPELFGRRLGIVGLGRSGSLMARIGQAFGMRVTAWSVNLTADRCAELGVEMVGRSELFSESDYISVHVLGSPRAVKYVTADDIKRMKPTAYLVNTSRGFIVDEDALVDALRENRIAGAGLDVFVHEPLAPDHPLRTLPNTVLSPHHGYVATGLYEQWGRELVSHIGAYLDGAPVNLLTPEQPFLSGPEWWWGTRFEQETGAIQNPHAAAAGAAT
jgi:phosphoglycerate dehydrogenase-like enzyme